MKKNLTPLQQLRQALNLVGERQLRIRWSEESPVAVTVQDDQIVVILSVTRRADIHRGTKITHQGTRGYIYRPRTDTPGWYLAESIEAVNKLAEPIYEYSTWMPDEDEYLERKLHEDMCYRPGTSSFPMDGPKARR